MSLSRRGMLLGAAALVPASALASSPAAFAVRELESIVFQQVYEAYQRERRPPSDMEQLKFYWSARAHLVQHFDAVGWPAEVPDLFVRPPGECRSDPLGYSGCAAYHSKDGEDFFWLLGWRKGEWTRVTSPPGENVSQKQF